MRAAAMSVSRAFRRNSRSSSSSSSSSSSRSLDDFWKVSKTYCMPTQLQRYEKKGSPDGIKKFIMLGGGPKMGATCENYARYRFSCLSKRKKGRFETGYDHIIATKDKSVYLEQKSCGHWGERDFRWQHIERRHKWEVLLLCGIGYTDVSFWVLNRFMFDELVKLRKITNQGNRLGESSEGMWCNYLDIKDAIVPVHTNEDLLAFIATTTKNDHLKKKTV